MADPKDKLLSEFGALLRELRTSAGYSQEGLALEANVDRTFLSKIERGKNQPTLSTVFLLASVLKVRPGELVRQLDERLSKRR